MKENTIKENTMKENTMKKNTMKKNKNDNVLRKRSRSTSPDIGNTNDIVILIPESPTIDTRKYKFHQFSVKPQRYALPIVGISGLIGIKYFQTFLYIPFFIFLSSVVLFWNFPQIILFNNKKPIYYDELFLDIKTPPLLNIDNKIRKKYESQFLMILILCNSLLLAGLSDYWLYRTQNNNSYIEIAGVTGGILKLFQYINLMLGKYVIFFSRIKIKEAYKTREMQSVLNNITLYENPLYNKDIDSQYSQL